MDWNFILYLFNPSVGGHTSRRCVDWNTKYEKDIEDSISHTSRRCVDWNDGKIEAVVDDPQVTPLVGVWIETRHSP